MQRTISAPVRQVISDHPAGVGGTPQQYMPYTTAASHMVGISWTNSENLYSPFGTSSAAVQNRYNCLPSPSHNVGMNRLQLPNASSPAAFSSMGCSRGWTCGMEETTSMNELNHRLETLCFSMAEAALSGIGINL